MDALAPRGLSIGFRDIPGFLHSQHLTTPNSLVNYSLKNFFDHHRQCTDTSFSRTPHARAPALPPLSRIRPVSPKTDTSFHGTANPVPSTKRTPHSWRSRQSRMGIQWVAAAADSRHSRTAPPSPERSTNVRQTNPPAAPYAPPQTRQQAPTPPHSPATTRKLEIGDSPRPQHRNAPHGQQTPQNNNGKTRLP